jgi:hypothetical protein
MGSFKDLPKDVMWLIFRIVIPQYNGFEQTYFEEHPCFCFGVFTSLKICDLALMSRKSLQVIRSKCYRLDRGYLFIKGSFTD